MKFYVIKKKKFNILKYLLALHGLAIGHKKEGREDLFFHWCQTKGRTILLTPIPCPFPVCSLEACLPWGRARQLHNAWLMYRVT